MKNWYHLFLNDRKISLDYIFSKNTKLTIEKRLFEDNNNFKIQYGRLYISTIFGELGCNFDIETNSIELTHSLSNIKVKFKNDNIILKVGDRYLKINENKIYKTRFVRFATHINIKEIKYIECENCIHNFCNII
jgi:hypothetical protein